MAKFYVSMTTASCTGFLWETEGTKKDLAKMEAVVKAYNTLEEWTRRGCDGTAYLQKTDADVVSFWRSQIKTRAKTLQGIKKMISEDGEVSKADPTDLADFLSNFERQYENLLPASI